MIRCRFSNYCVGGTKNKNKERQYLGLNDFGRYSRNNDPTG